MYFSLWGDFGLDEEIKQSKNISLKKKKVQKAIFTGTEVRNLTLANGDVVVIGFLFFFFSHS